MSQAHRGRCQACLEAEGAECHHLFTKAAHPELRHDPRNGILLCVYCHQTVHLDMTAFRKWWAGECPRFAEIYDPVTDRPYFRGGA
jgi:hypothetical protein